VVGEISFKTARSVMIRNRRTEEYLFRVV